MNSFTIHMFYVEAPVGQKWSLDQVLNKVRYHFETGLRLAISQLEKLSGWHRDALRRVFDERGIVIEPYKGRVRVVLEGDGPPAPTQKSAENTRKNRERNSDKNQAVSPPFREFSAQTARESRETGENEPVSPGLTSSKNLKNKNTTPRALILEKPITSEWTPDKTVIDELRGLCQQAGADPRGIVVALRNFRDHYESVGGAFRVPEAKFRQWVRTDIEKRVAHMFPATAQGWRGSGGSRPPAVHPSCEERELPGNLARGRKIAKRLHDEILLRVPGGEDRDWFISVMQAAQPRLIEAELRWYITEHGHESDGSERRVNLLDANDGMAPILRDLANEFSVPGLWMGVLIVPMLDRMGAGYGV